MRKSGLEYFTSLSPTTMKFGLERMQHALERLGHPEKKLKVIHVAGTNGKGSTCALIESCLRTLGLKVGLYTSPHLTAVNERFAVNRVNARDEEIEKIASNVLNVLGENHELTFFEFGTLVAVQHFLNSRVDVAVIETGLGGRLDATNCLVPVVCAITSISFDHEQYLGTTLAQIAGEKAGIIKSNVPVVLSVSKEEASEVLKKAAANLAIVEDEHFTFEGRLENGQWRGNFVFNQVSVEDVKVPLLGEHQKHNAATAMATVTIYCQTQGLRFPSRQLKAGIESASWVGRFEVLQHHGTTVVLDGAHNIDGVEQLIRTLDSTFGNRPVHQIFSMLKDKNFEAMATLMIARASDARFVELAHPRALSFETLVQTLSSNQLLSLTKSKALKSAIDDSVKSAQKSGGIVVISGSLVLIGLARHQLTK